MIDASDAVRDFLAADAALYALTGERLYGERDVPPVGYKPSDGNAICFKVRGGTPSYSDAFLEASIQFKCYGTTEADANSAYRALYEALHNKSGATVRWGQCEVLGQTLAEPATGWPFVLTFFKVWIANA